MSRAVRQSITTLTTNAHIRTLSHSLATLQKFTQNIYHKSNWNKGLFLIDHTYKKDQQPPESLPKTCRRGRPRFWPSRPEWTVRKGRQRASSEDSHLGISTTLTVGLHGIPRGSQQFHTGAGYSNPFQTRKVQQSQRKRKHSCCFRSLSDSPSHSPSLACELPPSQARCVSFYSCSFALSYSLVLSMPLPSSCLCSSVVTSFCGQEKRGKS